MNVAGRTITVGSSLSCDQIAPDLETINMLLQFGLKIKKFVYKPPIIIRKETDQLSGNVGVLMTFVKKPIIISSPDHLGNGLKLLRIHGSIKHIEQGRLPNCMLIGILHNLLSFKSQDFDCCQLYKDLGSSPDVQQKFDGQIAEWNGLLNCAINNKLNGNKMYDNSLVQVPPSSAFAEDETTGLHAVSLSYNEVAKIYLWQNGHDKGPREFGASGKSLANNFTTFHKSDIEKGRRNQLPSEEKRLYKFYELSAVK